MKTNPLLDPMLDRREFTLAAILAMLSGITITVSGCGGSPSSPSTPTPPAAGDKAATISANHGHTATITAAQLSAGGDLTIQLTEGSGHTHSVGLTGAEVVQIRDNQRVAKESSSNTGHSHTVTFN